MVRRWLVTAVTAFLLTAAMVRADGSAAQPAGSADCGGPRWVAAWTASMQGAGGPLTSSMTGHSFTPPNDTFRDQTLRQVAHLHFGGEQVRITLSNLFGTEELRVDEAHVGVRSEGAALQTGSDRQLTFAGAPATVISAGAEVVSDPIPLAVAALSDLVISVYTAGPTGPATLHANAVQTYYTAAGNHAADLGGDAFRPEGDVSTPYTATFSTQVYWVRMVEVLAPAGTRNVVAFGDSITDGFFSSGDTNHRYPDALARRFLANPGTARLAVVGQGISGGRVLHDGFGPSALHRLDREVLALNPAAVVFMQGLNDIGQPILVRPPNTLQERVTSEEIIAGYREIARRVHDRGARIIIGTMPPAGDATRPAPYGIYSTPDGVAKRHAVNKWILTEGRNVFDGVVDFDALLRWSINPDHYDPMFDAGDNLHPNDAGYQRMADAIPLDFFEDLPHC